MRPILSAAGLLLRMLVCGPASAPRSSATVITVPRLALVSDWVRTAAPAMIGVAAEVPLKLSVYFTGAVEVVVTFWPWAKQSTRDPKFENQSRWCGRVSLAAPTMMAPESRTA